MYQIKLVPHVVKQQTVLGEVDQPLDQQLLLVNGTHVGYVGNHQGAHINFIHSFPETVQKEIARLVAEAKGESVIPKTSAPVTDEEVNEALRAMANEREDDES